MIAFEPSRNAKWVLLNPEVCAIAILSFGFLGGLMAQRTWDLNLFERFGALTAGLGVFVFGLIAADLLNRAQDGYITREGYDPLNPYDPKVIRRALSLQSTVVLLGTLQWGFGEIFILAAMT